MASWYPKSNYDPRIKYTPPPYFGFGSSNQVYSNSRPRPNQVDVDGEDQPSRPYIPDSSDSVSFTAFGSTPNANGGIAADNVITLEPADNTHPGGVSIVAQTFAGNKTFTGAVEALSLKSDSFVDIPATTSNTVGVITQASTPLVHTFGTNNLFIGSGAGVFAAGGSSNICVGAGGLASLTTGQGNTGVGFGAAKAVTTGASNLLAGVNAGVNITTGSSNILVGPNTGAAITTQSGCVELGDGSLASGAANRLILGTNTTADCYIGGISGVAVGGTPQMVVINPANKQVGSQAFPASLSLAPIGSSSNANAATLTGAVLNLEPASSSFGGVVTTTSQSLAGVKTFTAAINLFATSSLNVGVLQQSGASLLHTMGTGNTFCGTSSGNFTLSGANNTALGSGALGSLSIGGSNVCVGQNAGSAITTTSNNILVANTGTVSDSGAIKIGTPGTQTSCIIAGVQGVAPGGTPQMVVINPATSQLGSQAIPASGSTTVGPISGASTANGASITGTTLNLAPADGTNGGVVTNTTQTFSGLKTFNSSINLLPTSSLAVGTIQSNGVQFMHSYGGLTNAFMGNSAGNFTLTSTNCTGIGSSALTALTSGNNNVAVGYNSGKAMTTGVFDTFVGSGAGGNCTTGQNNTFVGTNAGSPIITGQGNTLIGASAGFSSLSSLSHAIEVSDGTFGTSVDGDVRIGTSASLKCYLGGIQNTTTLASKQMMVIDPTSHLIESMSMANTTWSSTMTLDTGTITTMTVRGVSTTTIPLTLSLSGTRVVMTIPRFQMTAFTGTPHSFNLSGTGIPAAFYPTYQSQFDCSIANGASTASALIYVTSGGLVSIVLQSGGAFGSSPAGPQYDLHVAWNIV